MRLRRLHHLSFALALLLGQVLSFAHGFEHRALSADISCQLCVHAQGLDSGAVAPAVAAVVVPALSEAPPSLPGRPAFSLASQPYRARAPPSVFV